MRRVPSNTLRSCALWSGLSVVVVCALVACDRMSGTASGPAGGCSLVAQPGDLTYSPSGQRLAVWVLDDPDEPAPLFVVDASGRTEFTTSGRVAGQHWDIPLDWFPDGKRLLLRRVMLEPRREEEVLVLGVEDGAEARLPGARGRLGGTVLDDDSVVYLGHGEGGGPDGVHLYRHGPEGWSGRPILTDSEERQWFGALWGASQDGLYRMILTSQRVGPDGPVSEFWYGTMAPDGEVATSLVAEFPGERRAFGAAVSPDGSMLAVLRWSGGPRPAHLGVIPVQADSGEARSMPCSRHVSTVEFDRTGARLVLWGVGMVRGAPDRGGPLGEIWTVDLRTWWAEQVDIPPVAFGTPTTVIDVEWASADTLAIGCMGYGIAELDVRGGALRPVWRAPAAQPPSAPSSSGGRR